MPKAKSETYRAKFRSPTRILSADFADFLFVTTAHIHGWVKQKLLPPPRIVENSNMKAWPYEAFMDWIENHADGVEAVTKRASRSTLNAHRIHRSVTEIREKFLAFDQEGAGAGHSRLNELPSETATSPPDVAGTLTLKTLIAVYSVSSAAEKKSED